MDPTSRLVDVATAVADGAPVNWREVEARPGFERSVISGLELLERIAAVHASLPPVASFELVGEATLARDTAPPVGEAPAVWGPLTIVERIGSGTFADVYLARDPRLDRPVALKLLRRRTRDSATDPSDVIDEARLLARVSHPNVITVHGADRINGRVGIWMEYIDGQTLEQELHDRGTFPADELVRIGLAVCGALEAVHAAGVLHRDIKAQNILRDRAGRVRLADFGTGRETSDIGLGELAGTPLYLAPEVLAGGPSSPTSDVYSVGILLYHLATRSFPVAGRSLGDLRDAHRRGARVPARTARPGLPGRVAAVIDRATNLEPGRRYQSAQDLAAALAKARTGARDRILLVAGIGAVALGLGAAAVLSRRDTAPGHAVPVPPAGRDVLLAPAPSRPSADATHVPSVPPGGATAPPPPRTRELVLVPAFRSPDGNHDFDDGLAYALQWDLRDSAYLDVVPPERIADALRLMKRPGPTLVDPATAWDITNHDRGITRIVQGMIRPDGDGFRVSVDVAGPNGSVTAGFSEPTATATGLPVAVRHVANWVRRYLGEAAASVNADEARLANASMPSLQTIALYSEGEAAARAQKPVVAEDKLRSATAADPDLASAQVLLAWVLKNRGRPESTYLPLLQRAVGLAPGASARDQDFILASEVWMTGQQDRALGAVEGLTRLYPDDAWRLDDLRFLYERAARRGDADDIYIRVSNLRPNDEFAALDAAAALLVSRGLTAALPYVERARAVVQIAGPTIPGSGWPNQSLFQGLITWPRTNWLRLFPVHELWLKHRSTDAAAALAAAADNPDIVGDLSALNILGSLQLAFGQLQAADDAFARINYPSYRLIGRAEVALARGDAGAVAAALQSYAEGDAAPVALLLLSGNLAAADDLATRISPALQERDRQWVRAEIDAARGSSLSENSRHLLEAAVQFFAPIAGERALLDSEILADAQQRAGQPEVAIQTLEATTPLRERTYGRAHHGGYLWMRCQARLAALYREHGQIDKARKIERDLIAVLATADADDALLLELKRRTP